MYCVIHIFVFGNLLSQTYPSTAVNNFNVSQFNHTWDKTANNCEDGWKFSGKEIFNSCRSDSCQTVNANDVLPNVKNKPPFLWIDGYVVRSPVMEYYECLKLGHVYSSANVLAHQKDITLNGVEKCSLFCQQHGKLKSKDFILLQNKTCYCLPEKTQRQWNNMVDVLQKASTENCDIQCDDDKFDRCGGKTNLFSAYKLTDLPISAEIDGNCYYTPGSGTRVKSTKCKDTLKFKCEQVVESDGSRIIKVKCYELIVNWYDARRTCNQSGKYIKLLNNKCDNIEHFKTDKLWHNTFIKERIIWNTSIVNDMEKNQGYSCLAMQLTTNSKYILTAKSCDNKYYSLCQKDVSGQNIDGTQAFTSVSRIDQSTIYSTPNIKEQKTEDSQNVQDNFTWIQSASRCILANEHEVKTANVSYPLSWIGGYILPTPWVSYLGCFYNVTSFKDDYGRFQKISPAACLSKCDAYDYFTLEDEHCRCLISKTNLQTTDPENCNSGIKNKYFNVYKTIQIMKDSDNPRGFNDQKLHCTIVKLDKKTNKVYVKAAKCDTNHSILCQTSDKEFSVIDDHNYTYAVAQKKCNILDYYSLKDNVRLQNITFEGKSYWTNVLRFLTERWVDNTTDIDALKDITKNMINQRCIYATQGVGPLLAVRKLPCNNVLPFRCSPAYTTAVAADTLNTGTLKHTTSHENQSKFPFPEATSTSYNTTDSSGSGYKKFEEDEEIDRTRITDVFILIIGITSFLSILIISTAIFVFYLYNQKRKQYSLEIQDRNAIKTRRDLYFATEDICSDYLDLQWIPTLNPDNSVYTALNSVGKNTSKNNVNTEIAINETMKSNDQGSSTQNVNSGNAAHTVRPVSSTKYATSTVTKSARLGTSTDRANNANAAYTAVKLIRHIPSNEVDINTGIETKTEYHHLDFTLKSDEKCVIDGNEHNRTKQKENDMVYEDPWDEETSKFQRAFSQIRQGMVHRGRSIRKSILKRQSRIRDNDAYTVTELSVDNVVYDSPKAENAKKDVAENIIEGKDMQNKAEAMDGVTQCTLRNKVTRQSKCIKPDTRRSSVKLTFQRMFSLKTFKTPASIEQSNNASSPDDNS